MTTPLATTLISLFDEWSAPRPARHNGKIIPFELVCRARPPASFPQLQTLPVALPQDVVRLYEISNGADLFKDERYGQWGLELLSVVDSRRQTDEFRIERQADVEETDLVIGRFLGDSDLLMIDCNHGSTTFGNAVVATPLDPRCEWYTVAPDLAAFLALYRDHEGAKFWE